MYKKIFKAMLFATLPMVAIHADTNLTKIHPLKEDPIVEHFEKIQAEMSKIFEEFTKDIIKESGLDSKLKINIPDLAKDFDFSQPKTDLRDKGDHYEIKMDIPGMNAKNIKIDVTGNYLSITAKAEEEKKEEKENGRIIHQERHVGIVQRGMTLPKDADVSNYKSSYKDGVLIIDIPKKK